MRAQIVEQERFGIEREAVSLAVGGAGGLVVAGANAVEQVLIIEEEALESAPNGLNVLPESGAFAGTCLLYTSRCV